MVKRTAIAALSLVLAILLAGCAHRLPTAPAHIRGVITSLAEGSNGTLSLRVVWDASLGAQLQYDAAQVSVTSKTRVFATSTGKVTDAVEISSERLRVRDVVDVWFTGAVRESYPVQVDAQNVLVLGQWNASQPLPTPPGLTPPDSGQ